MDASTFIQINAKQNGYQITETVHQGTKHLVVPVTMIVEGVLNGSQGPLLHLAEEFGKIPGSWDGIPVVINHPQKDGVSISANSPEIIDSMTVGRVYNSRVELGMLKAEVWLDDAKLGIVSPDIYTAVKAKKPIEVSMGAFTENEPTEGQFNGVTYKAIARNHRPDHLALLPGSVGACSLEDGCGIHANSENSELILNMEVKIMADKTPCTPCVEKKVNELIANKQTKFTDSDKEWLQTLELSVLEKMEPEKVEPVTVEKVVEKVVANEMSKEDKAALDFGKKMLAKRKADMSAAIQANTKAGTWPEEVLANMDEEMLERVFDSVKKEETTDYSLNGGNTVPMQSNAGKKTEVLLPNFD